MKRFKNIVLIYECDRATLDRAAALAEANHARLTVVQVVKAMPPQWRHYPLDKTPHLDLQKLAVKECEALLKNFISPLKREGLRISSKVLVGTAYLEVIREVLAHKRDLVIMTAEGTGGLKERLFGSTSLHLMRKCPCPVWVMKPTRRKPFLQVLAAIDPDPQQEDRESLNATILQLASSLASIDAAELHVVHAWTLFGESIMRGRGGFTESEIRRCEQDVAEKHRRAMDGLLAMHTDGAAIIHLVKGEADVAIPELVRSENIDLLVMGTVCRIGIAGFFIGNTAETVLDDVQCSVLTVKPAGFESPVMPI